MSQLNHWLSVLVEVADVASGVAERTQHTDERVSGAAAAAARRAMACATALQSIADYLEADAQEFLRRPAVEVIDVAVDFERAAAAAARARNGGAG